MGKKKKKEKVIYCDPKVIIHDTYKEREVTFVHPIIKVNREHIVNVPKHVYEKKEVHEVIDPGYPTKCDCKKKKEKKKKKRSSSSSSSH
ncbi:hypothetical protein QUF84_13335 [Fictibacillus enclensis]|uniref:hypothetical protein n=1 Tax=Fictibacillus enclensis TaxID=1017270 RepID=UPI0025A1D412|nr:hypothetical protein [Fictibacillus enclensis]MDM5338204.1 hypothetical protein [Fictibacillus enclensis]